MNPDLALAEWYGREIEVVIDRPLGSVPLNPDTVYDVNYGFVEGTTAPDGHALDVCVLGAELPLERCTARVIAIIRRREVASTCRTDNPSA